MTIINHRRKNKQPVNKRATTGETSYFHNGYGRPGRAKNESWQRTGRTDYLDKSLHGWGRVSTLADKSVGACIGNDFALGHRGMARAVKGAKKFVRTRIRFHENATTKKMANTDFECE